MSRAQTAVLAMPRGYDECRIAACLKKLLLISRPKPAAAPELKLSDNIASFAAGLAHINHHPSIELTAEYLSAMEQSLPGVEFRYAMVYQDGRPVLFAYFQVFTLTSSNFKLKGDKSVVRRIVEFFLNLKKVHVVIAGNALRSATDCYCFDAEALSEDKALEIVAAAAEKVACTECASGLILRDIGPSASVKKWLASAGFHTPWVDNIMKMEVDPDWLSLGDYVNCLSKKYKARAQKTLDAGASLTTRELSKKEIAGYNDGLIKLFRNVTAHQPFVLTNIGDDHFLQMKEVYSDDFEVIGAFEGEELVSFLSAFRSDGVYEVYYVGFDYSRNNQYQLYFNLLFTALGRAIELKANRLLLGRTSFDAKASLGATPVQLDYYFKPGNIASLAIKWFTGFFSGMEDGKWRLRNPLKEKVKVI